MHNFTLRLGPMLPPPKPSLYSKSWPFQHLVPSFGGGNVPLFYLLIRPLAATTRTLNKSVDTIQIISNRFHIKAKDLLGIHLSASCHFLKVQKLQGNLETSSNSKS